MIGTVLTKHVTAQTTMMSSIHDIEFFAARVTLRVFVVVLPRETGRGETKIVVTVIRFIY